MPCTHTIRITQTFPPPTRKCTDPSPSAQPMGHTSSLCTHHCQLEKSQQRCRYKKFEQNLNNPADDSCGSFHKHTVSWRTISTGVSQQGLARGENNRTCHWVSDCLHDSGARRGSGPRWKSHGGCILNDARGRVHVSVHRCVVWGVRALPFSGVIPQQVAHPGFERQSPTGTKGSLCLWERCLWQHERKATSLAQKYETGKLLTPALAQHSGQRLLKQNVPLS